MTEPASLTPAEMRTTAVSLRAVLEEIDAKTLKASGRERAFVAGALRAVELVIGDGATTRTDACAFEGD